MSAPTLTELPAEVLFDICYSYISDEDVRNLNRIRNRRLVAITTSYLKYNKSKLIFTRFAIQLDALYVCCKISSA